MSTATAPTLAAVQPVRTSQADRRALVMRCAIDAIAARGLADVRLEDIAARAHMSVGHVMYYFGRRDRLLMATLVWSEEDAHAELVARLARMRSHARKIAAFAETYLPSRSRDPRWGLWFQLSGAPGEPLGDVGALRAVDESWRATFVGLVHRGVEAGAFRRVDADDVAEWYLPYLDGLSLDVLTGPADASVRPTVLRARSRIRRMLEYAG